MNVESARSRFPRCLYGRNETIIQRFRGKNSQFKSSQEAMQLECELSPSRFRIQVNGTISECNVKFAKGLLVVYGNV